MVLRRDDGSAREKSLQPGDRTPPTTAQSPVILAVSPFAEDRERLAEIFDKLALELCFMHSAAEAMGILREKAVAVVITECFFPDGLSWKYFLQATETLEVPPRLIVTSRLADDRLWAEVLNLGGYDMLMKPFDVQEVFRVVSVAQAGWEHARARKPAAAMVSDPRSPWPAAE